MLIIQPGAAGLEASTIPPFCYAASWHCVNLYWKSFCTESNSCLAGSCLSLYCFYARKAWRPSVIIPESTLLTSPSFKLFSYSFVSKKAGRRDKQENFSLRKNFSGLKVFRHRTLNYNEAAFSLAASLAHKHLFTLITLIN